MGQLNPDLDTDTGVTGRPVAARQCNGERRWHSCEAVGRTVVLAGSLTELAITDAKDRAAEGHADFEKTLLGPSREV